MSTMVFSTGSKGDIDGSVAENDWIQDYNTPFTCLALTPSVEATFPDPLPTLRSVDRWVKANLVGSISAA